MTFPPPTTSSSSFSPSAQSPIASAPAPSASASASADTTRSSRPSSHNISRRGLAPLATTNITAPSFSAAAAAAAATASSSSPSAATAPLTSTFSSILSGHPQPSGSVSATTATATSRFQSRNHSHSVSLSSSSLPHQQHQQQHSAAATTGGGGGGGFSFTTSSSPSNATSTNNNRGVAVGGTPQAIATAANNNNAATAAVSALSSPTGSFEKPGSGASGSTSSSSSLSKISVAQVFLLLDSITEKEGKEKWETKAAQIHKLVEANGMDVFSKYFRRLVSGNAAQIFPGINKAVENAGNYPLLVQEMHKVRSAAEQAQKIADTIDASDGDVFRDFDLATFLDHFFGPNAGGAAAKGAQKKTAAENEATVNAGAADTAGDPVSKVALVLAFRCVSRNDLRQKADTILANSMPPFLASLSLSTVPDSNKDFSPSFIASILERLILNPPPNYINAPTTTNGSSNAANAANPTQATPTAPSADLKHDLFYAITSRYAASPSGIPPEIENALQMFGLSDPKLSLVRQIQVKGPKAMQTQESIVDLINSVGPSGWSEEQIATALLFITISSNWRQYSPQLLLTTAQQRAPEGFDWSLLPRAFDRPHLRVDTEQFTRLYNTLLAASRDVPDLDVQMLWGGDWSNRDCQISFLAAFVSSNIDVTTIPNFRAAFTTDIFADLVSTTSSDAVRHQVAAAERNPFRSYDAVKAVFDLIIASTQTWAQQDSHHFVTQLLQPNLPVFLVSAFAIPQPWMPVQLNFVMRTISVFITKAEGYEVALHGVWKLDRQSMSDALFRAFNADPRCSELIYEHAVEHGWLKELLGSMNGLSMDLACLAHRDRCRGREVSLEWPPPPPPAASAGGSGAGTPRPGDGGKMLFDLERWVNEVSQSSPHHMGELLVKFLKIKAEDELAFQRKETPVHRMVPLDLPTVYALLVILEDQLGDQKPLHDIQRYCVQTYPRLINYGCGFDELIERNNNTDIGSSLPDLAEREMQDLFGKMYHEELSLRQILELMRRYKASQNPHEQDLFTTMVHGLIDEYNCYPEYPIEALTKAAVLFGGLINFRLVSGITLQVCLSLILDSVTDRSPDDSMFKFGVEAIEQIGGRLAEWPGFCAALLQVPTLQGTPLYAKADEVVREQAGEARQPMNGVTADEGSLNGDAFHTQYDQDAAVAQRGAFRALHVDPPLRPEIYREPGEEVHDKILFILNNVSEQNIEDKLKDLKTILLDEHHQWFASYLVEERARVQPNFQQLYLYLLDLLDNKMLWAEVLRETYASAVKLLNNEATMHNSTDRNYLKNLGSWLGALTIARDKPVKHKNIYFRDLLVEAFDTQRLIVAIPFTCKVLVQARKSTVFKPPNPWLMDILALLTEIYHFGDLKMILKFEIEVVCQDLEIDLKSIEPSTYIRERPPKLEDMVSGPAVLADAAASASAAVAAANAAAAVVAGGGMPEGLEVFEDMSLNGMNRAGVRPGAISPTAVLRGLSSLEQVIVVPPSAGGALDAAILRQVVLTAVERAITEIIAPVVERSITIASISTAQLILKDFATEPDEEKLRHAAITMVRALAGSLALVTCKEPLKMSMMNYMKVLQQEITEHPVPEGMILMCVNENLDAACGIVEKAAEERSVPEIEKAIEPACEARRRYRAAHPGQPYVDPSISRWAFFIPEPYRQIPGGLNAEQMAIYDIFAHQARTPGAAGAGAPPGHHMTASIDSAAAKQMPELLPENYPGVPSMQTPADVAAVPHVPAALQHESLQHQVAAAAADTPHANGFVTPAAAAAATAAAAAVPPNPTEKLEQLVRRLQESARNAGVEHIKDLARDTPILQDYHLILKTLYTLPDADQFARIVAQAICIALHEMTETNLEVEILVHLLSRLCELAPIVSKDSHTHLALLNENQLFNVPTLIAVNDVGLLEFALVDPVLAKMIASKDMHALETLSGLLDRVLLNDEPSGLRSDFAASLEAMTHWFAEDPNLSLAADIIKKLRDAGIPEVVTPLLSDEARSQRDQAEYIFSEWLGLYRNLLPGEAKYIVFLDDLHERGAMSTQENSALFLRVAVDLSVAIFEHISQTNRANLDEAFLAVDALAKLVILLVKHKKKTNEADAGKDDDRPAYLNSILSLLVLVMNHHMVMRGANFNQRVFFRLFSSILCEYYASQLHLTEQHKDMMLVFTEKLLAIQPMYMPGFAFAWAALISHRDYLAGMLTMAEQAGWAPYCEVIQALLSYIGDQLKAPMSWPTRELYNGVLRILLILHHDFPEFILENHYNLCNVIPAHCSQLRNLILSPYPSSFPKLDPFREGLKMDSLEETRQTPKIAGDIAGPIERVGIKNALDACLKSGSSDENVTRICNAVNNPEVKETALANVPINVDVLLINSLVLYLADNVVRTAAPQNEKGFADSHATALLDTLIKTLDVEGRYYLLSAIANQLRYPNSHTHYFSFFILHLFGLEPTEQQGLDIREQIVRVLLERLIVHRPHPWGLIITLQELLQSNSYAFFDLPFIRETPEIGRLFDALVAHIQQQSPGAA